MEISKSNDNIRNHKWKDLTGLRFGELVAIEYLPLRNKNGKRISKWKCKCDCGNVKEVTATHLTQGETTSCGCVHSKTLHDRLSSHNMSKTRFYRIWAGMKSRCLNLTATDYSNYGGRGIKPCTEWLKFKNFKIDMYISYLEHTEKFGEKNTTLDRKNSNGNYDKNNCRWATIKEQSFNKRVNKRYSVNGENLTLTELYIKYSIPRETIFSRIKTGLEGEELIKRRAKNVRDK